MRNLLMLLPAVCAVSSVSAAISDPSQIAGLYLRLEADSIVGLANGAAVTSWTDSLSSYEFTGTATYDAYYAHGHAAVYFNGIDNMLVNRTLVGAPNTANLTLFVVGNFTTAGNDGVSDFMISGQYPTGSTANRLRILKRLTTGMIDIAVGAGSVSSNIIAADTDRHVYTIVSGQTGNAVKFLIDNTALRTTNSGTGAVALQALGLGAYHTGNEQMGNQFGDCSIAEVLLYDRALTDSDMTIVYNYLREKYFYDIPDAVYQAEDCTAYSDCAISSEHAGATGENNEYVDMGGMNSWFEWDFIDGGTSGGNTALTFRYAVGDSSSRLCEISLNGVFAGTLNFPSTGSWDAWSIAIMDITLMPGLNTIRVTAATGTGGPNVDKMEVGQATVSFERFAQFAQWWLHTHCHLYGHCGGADLDRDGTVTLKDYAILARQWLKGQVGLQLHLPFDETSGSSAMDMSIHNRSGILLGNPVWQPAAGVSGGALSFDGVDDYVRIMNYPGVIGTSARTVSAWIKSPGSGGNMVIMNWGDNQPGGQFLFGVFSNGSAAVYSAGPFIRTTQTVLDNEWHHVAAVMPGGWGSSTLTDVSLYIDGILQTDTHIHDNRILNTIAAGDVTIGALRIGPNQTDAFFKGLMDDVRLYDRQLDYQEILELMY